MIRAERLKLLLWYLPEDIAEELGSTIRELQEKLNQTQGWLVTANLKLLEAPNTKLQAENERLRELMPKTGETCEHRKAFHCKDTCACSSTDICRNGKWELKDAK